MKLSIKRLSQISLSTIALLFAYDCTTKEQCHLRNLRTVRCGLNLLYNYKIRFIITLFLIDMLLLPRFSAETANEIHEMIAKDIYETCIKNDGLYVKFGQQIASVDYVEILSLIQINVNILSYFHLNFMSTCKNFRISKIFNKFYDN